MGHRITTAAEARAQGLTCPVFIEAGHATFYALINPHADLDGCFSAFDTDSNELLAVNGWLCSVEPDPDTTGIPEFDREQDHTV